MCCSWLLIPPKKVLTLAGIELESPRLPVCSADHSATRNFVCQKNIKYLYWSLYWWILNPNVDWVLMWWYWWCWVETTGRREWRASLAPERHCRSCQVCRWVTDQQSALQSTCLSGNMEGNIVGQSNFFHLNSFHSPCQWIYSFFGCSALRRADSGSRKWNSNATSTSNLKKWNLLKLRTSAMLRSWRRRRRRRRKKMAVWKRKVKKEALHTGTGNKSGRSAGRTSGRNAEANPSWSGRVSHQNVLKLRAKRTVSSAKIPPSTAVCPFYSDIAPCPSFWLPAVSAVLKIPKIPSFF